MKHRIAQHVAWQQVADELIIIDLRHKRALGLNPVASLIWPLLENQSLDALTQVVLQQFPDVEPASIRADIVRFVADMEQRGLLVAA